MMTAPERKSKLQFARASPASRASHCYLAATAAATNAATNAAAIFGFCD